MIRAILGFTMVCLLIPDDGPGGPPSVWTHNVTGVWGGPTWPTRIVPAFDITCGGQAPANGLTAFCRLQSHTGKVIETDTDVTADFAYACTYLLSEADPADLENGMWGQNIYHESVLTNSDPDIVVGFMTL